ncbi:MAG: amidohydrolase family protein [Acidimicrobiales bacterium]
MTDQLVLTNLRLFTGIDGEVIDQGAVVIEGETIAFAGPQSDMDSAPADATEHDLGGRFVMPGMTESHVHLAYNNVHPQQLNSRDTATAMLDAADNARRVLGAGFTSAISFGSAQGIDLPLKQAIDEGRIPGPRLAASDRDLGSTGSNADSASPSSEGQKIIVDGPWAVRAAVRSLAKKGVDIVKIFLDGEAISAFAPPGVLSYTDEEVAAAVEESHNRQMRIVSHSRSAASVKQALRHGIDIVGHANYLDDEAVEMMRQARDRVFVCPAIAWEITLLERGHEIGLSREAMVERGYQAEVDATISAVKRLREVGVRVLVGGDYGLNITPHGSQAKELEYFVDLFDMTPTEALLCATRDGGAAADPTGMVGTLEEGKYADLVVFDGDPTAEITELSDLERIHAVMKGGVVYRHLNEPDRYSSTL